MRIDLTGSTTDTVAPPKPSRIGARGVSGSNLTLTWSPVTDNGGRAGDLPRPAALDQRQDGRDRRRAARDGHS